MQVLSLPNSEQVLTTVQIGGDKNDYREILAECNTTFTQVPPYLFVGGEHKKCDWVIHASVVGSQQEGFFLQVVSFLVNLQVPFKMVDCRQNGDLVINGGYGYELLGKILSVYPADDGQAIAICHRLVQVTSALRGPAIAGAFRLAGAIYVEYGGTGKRPVPILPELADGRVLLKYFKALAFVLPAGVKWLFGDIRPYLRPDSGDLVKGRYLVRTILKSDVKGHVSKAIYLKGGWPAVCVIKEGVSCINEDGQGRDAADRITWQWQLYNRLKGVIPMAEVLDYFRAEGKAYLVTKFIKCRTLEQAATTIFQGRAWQDLSDLDKQKIAGYVQTVLGYVRALHLTGIVHRDLTPYNFVVDDKGMIVALDLELAYDLSAGAMVAPFLKGTAGYMSGEQQMGAIPTIKEDVYAIGALIIFLFTGLYPNHFCPEDCRLKDNLIFFLGEEQMAGALSRCLSDKPGHRPAIEEVNVLAGRFGTAATSAGRREEYLTRQALLEVVTNGLCGLSLPIMFDGDGIWKSVDSGQVKVFSGEVRKEITDPGFFDGVSGVLYLFFQAVRCGIKWPYDPVVLNRNISFVLGHLEGDRGLSPGPATGESGICLMLWEGLAGGLFSGSEKRIISKITGRGSDTSVLSQTDVSLSSGAAGIILSGIHLLRTAGPPLDSLSWCADLLCRGQKKDGSWEGVDKTGMLGGAGGIIWALLDYHEYFQEERSRTAVLKGLSWLLRQTKSMDRKTFWYTDRRKTEVDPWLTGNAGIALVLLKAWQLFGDKRYLQAGQGALEAAPPKIMTNSFSMAKGLSGLGQAYLSAWLITGSDKWKDRADWIAQVFGHTLYRPSEGAGCWLTDRSFQPLPGLLNGGGGPIHFLLRYLYPENISLPGFPI